MTAGRTIPCFRRLGVVVYLALGFLPCLQCEFSGDGLIEEDVVVMTSGGKRAFRAWWRYHPETDDFSREQTFTIPPSAVGRPGLGTARFTVLVPTAGAPRPKQGGIVRSSRALFAGGVGPNGEFASDQAYVFDLATELWTSLEMAEPRAGHTLTGLPDGRALVAGGWDGEDALASAELFNPDTTTFVPTGSMSSVRLRAAAALLDDGRVLICGGSDNGADPNYDPASAETYDPETGQFSATGPMTRGRSFHAAVTLDDGRVLVVGDNGSNSAEVYDPSTGLFAPVEDMSVTHGSWVTATRLISGKVLIVGGLASPNGGVTDVAELFDPATDEFTDVGSLHTARVANSATLLPDGRVLIAGGRIADGDTVASAEVFDPATNQFSVIASEMPQVAADHAAVLLSSR